MSLATRKPVFGGFWLKPACLLPTATGWSLEILDLASISIILPRQRTTKTLIRLHIRAGWSASLLDTYDINRFSHDVAQMVSSIFFEIATHIRLYFRNGMMTLHTTNWMLCNTWLYDFYDIAFWHWISMILDKDYITWQRCKISLPDYCMCFKRCIKY